MGKKNNYSHLSLDEWSDDDSDDGGGYRDNVNGEGNEADEYIKNQQVRTAQQASYAFSAEMENPVNIFKPKKCPCKSKDHNWSSSLGNVMVLRILEYLCLVVSCVYFVGKICCFDSISGSQNY